MPTKPPAVPLPRPVGYRARTQANWEAQAALHKEIIKLPSGLPRSDAEARLLKLRTDLLALNVEMRLRVGQDSGHA